MSSKGDWLSTWHPGQAIPDHRNWPSLEEDNHGFFPAPWVGIRPKTEKRRAYMKAYANWMFQSTPEAEKQLWEEAEQLAARGFVRRGYPDDVKTSYFEWLVDMYYWHLRFSALKPSPPWPWPSPLKDPDDKGSERLARILDERHAKEEEKEQQKRQQREDRKRQRSNSLAEKHQESQRRRLEAPADERGEFSQTLDAISFLVRSLRCVMNDDFDMSVVGFLIPRVADPESRQRLFYYLDVGPEDIWFCLTSICADGYSGNMPMGWGCCCPHHEELRHCVRIVLEDGVRKLRFKFGRAPE